MGLVFSLAHWFFFGVKNHLNIINYDKLEGKL